MRFTTRDLLWLMVVVAVSLALSLAWFRDRTRLMAEMDESNRVWISTIERAEREINASWKQVLDRRRDALKEVLDRQMNAANHEQEQTGPASDNRQ